MQKFSDVVIDRKGNVVTTASVLVKALGTSTPATIYAANSTAQLQSNPISVDSFGRFSFYAPNGRYSLEVYIGSALFTVSDDILLEDPADATPEVIDGGVFKNGALENVTIDGKAPMKNGDIFVMLAGAKGDGGLTNNRDAIASTIAAASGRIIYVPVDALGGQYAITSGTLTIPDGQRFLYEGDARIYAAGGTVTDNGRHVSLLGPGNTRESVESGKGIAVILNGGNTGTVTDRFTNYNLLKIRNDRINAEGGIGSKVNGLLIDHVFGGAGTRGGRHGMEINLTQSAIAEAASVDRNYVALSAHVTSGTADGGTEAAVKGAYFGVEAMVYLAPGAINAHNCTAILAEPFIATGASARNREAIQITSKGTQRGMLKDSAISLSCGSAEVTFKYGMYFNNENGQVPLGADSSALKIDAGAIIDAVIDASGVTATHILRTATTTLSDSAFAMRSPSPVVTLGTRGAANSPAITFFSGAADSGGGDASITATGGNGSSGNGSLTINSGTVAFKGTPRPTVDNAVPSGNLSFRWRETYSVRVYLGAGAAFEASGTGSPEGVLAAPVGSTFRRTDGGANTTLYVKETGTGNTGWVAK